MDIFAAGAIDVSIYFRLRNSTTGLPQPGLAFNSAGAYCSYVRPRSIAQTITLATLANPAAAWADGGFIEVDAALATGLYRLDLPVLATSSGANSVNISIGFTGVIGETQKILLNPEPNIVQGQVQADGGNTASSFKTNLPSSEDGFYQEAFMLFRTGPLALAGPRKVTAYAGSTQFVTVTPAFTSTPPDNEEFILSNR